MLEFLVGVFFGSIVRQRVSIVVQVPAPAPTKVPERLLTVPNDLHESLQLAALQYASMSPSDFDAQGELFVGSSRLRDVGLIDTAVWARVPANDSVRVQKQRDGSLAARVMLPMQ